SLDLIFFFSSRRRHTRSTRDWSSDVCSSDLDKKEARDLKTRVEENLKLLERGRLAYQPGDDLITLLLSDGKLNVPVHAEKQVTRSEERRVGKEGKTRR